MEIKNIIVTILSAIERVKILVTTEERHQKQKCITSVFSHILASIVQTNSEGIIVGWYGQIESIFGYKKKEIIGKSILTLFPADDLNTIHDYVLAWLETHDTLEMRVKCKNKDTTNFYILLKCSKIDIEQELFILYSFMEEKDNSNLNLLNYKDLLDTSPTIVQILDREGYNVWYNKAFLDFYTIPPAKEYSFFKTELYEKIGIGPYIKKVLAGEIVKVPPTWVNLFKVDEHAPMIEYCLESIFYPIKDGAGIVQYIVMFEIVVTEQVLAEKLITENQKKNALLIKYTGWILSLLESSEKNPIDIILQKVEQLILKIQDSIDDSASKEMNFQHNGVIIPDDIKNIVLNINGSSIATLLQFGEHYPDYLYPKQLSELTGFNSSVISKKIKILLRNNLIEEKFDFDHLEDNRKKLYGISKSGLQFFVYLRDIMKNTALLAERKELEEEITRNLKAISYLEEKKFKKM